MILAPRFTRFTRGPFRLGCLLALITTSAAPAAAGDWPQILGPERNGRVEGEPLLAWPEGGPREAWKYAAGAGFAGPVVAGERVVIFHRQEGEERLEALDLATGRELWRAGFPAEYRPGINPDDGPRCVPLVHDGAVYAFGAAGDVYSVSLADGAKRWTRNLYVDYGGDEGYFGAGSTPIVAGGKLLVNVGGREEAGLVALALDTGRTLWHKTEEGASYSSPVASSVAGKPAAVVSTRMSALAIDPAEGAILFQFPFGKRGPTVNAAMPLIVGDKLFLTASYGIGARCDQLGPGEPRTLWANDETLSSQYNTPIHHGGFLYGIHGREDIGTAELRCVEAATGRVRWSETGFGVAHMIGSGDRLLILKIDGELLLAEAGPEKFTPLARTSLTGEVYRALPALAHGRLLVRSNRGRGDAFQCLELPQK